MAAREQDQERHHTRVREVRWGERMLYQAFCSCGWLGQLQRGQRAKRRASSEGADHVLEKYLADLGHAESAGLPEGPTAPGAMPAAWTTCGREEAGRIAQDYLAGHPGGGARGIRAVYSLEEIPFRKPCLYGVPLENRWVCYVDGPLTGLRSSGIIVVAKDTGAVVYAGSACDEG